MSRDLRSLPQAEEARQWATERYLRRLIAERRIPFHKVGGRVLVDLDDLDAYAEAGRVEPCHSRPTLVRKGKGAPKGAITTITTISCGNGGRRGHVT